MTKISKEDTLNIFNKIKKKAHSQILEGNIESAAKQIENAAIWANLFNFKFYDNDLEDDLRMIANRIGQSKTFVPIPGRLVFICSQMHDNGELVRHYVRAIADNGIPTRLIVFDKKVAFGYSNTLKEINESGNIELIFLPSELGYIDAAKRIATLIEEYRPSKILQHFVPSEVKCLLGVSFFPQIPKYNINYTDHTFWLGASFLDYNIEFRPYGYLLSKEKRNISKNNIYILPLYPIVDESIPFQGLPVNNKDGKIIIFSGGSPYKVFGDNDKYFKILDEILYNNKNCVALIAIYNNVIIEKVKKMICNDRVFLVNFRRDICEVIKHIDIFYNSYPVGGGLICLLAANYEKPILAFAKDGCLLSDIDGMFLDHSDKFEIGHTSVEKLINYAHYLCSDELFRQKEGAILHEYCTNRAEFADEFKKIINNKKKEEIENVPLDIEGVFDFCYNSVNETSSFIPILFQFERFKALYHYPQFELDLLVFIFHQFIAKVKICYNNIKNKV